MVGHGRAAAQDQLAQPHLGAGIDRFGSQLGPDGVKEGQPIEEHHPRAGAYGPGQVLVKVVVAVDETGDHHAAGPIVGLIDSLLGQVRSTAGQKLLQFRGRPYP